VRGNNEDSGFAGPYLQLVADGVGGAAAGEVASATAAYVTCASTMGSRDEDLLDVLARAVRLAQEQLSAGVDADPARAGMGTTLTAVLTDGSAVALAHLGDSRAYLLRDGALTQLSRDQTLVQMLVDEGEISPEQARTHPQKNVVLQALDGAHPAEPDLCLLDLRPGDRLLVCSDGLTDMVDDAALARGLALEDLDAASDALVEAALDAGGRDNVTVLVSEVEEGPMISRDGATLGALGDPYLILDPSAVRG
jgi:protein phosphatase